MPDRWEGERVQRWLAAADRLEGQLAPVADALFATVDLQPGERVLDVGCGHGPTTRRAAVEVGSTGAVVGLDVSEAMIAAAEEIAVTDGSARIEWVAEDATTWSGDSVDVVISRFGVMFFEDPQAAFVNLARVTRPGGRLRVAVWANRLGCPVFEVPLAAALESMRAIGVDIPGVPAPDAGAFSLGDEGTIRDLLSGAGWADVECERQMLSLPVGGGAGPVDAAAATMEVGAVRVVTDGMDDDGRARVAEAIVPALEPHVIDGEVRLDGEIIVVSARRADA